MQAATNLLQITLGYLLGLAFAGSFLGRKYMGYVDILLHRLFRRKITLAQYLYWKYFCGIANPPKPGSMKRAEKAMSELRKALKL